MEKEEEKQLIKTNTNANKYSYINFITFSLQISSLYFIDLIPISFSYYLLKAKQDNLLTAAFGFGLTYQNFCFVFVYGFSEAFGVFGSRYYGARNFNSFNIILFQTLGFMFLFLILSVSLMVYNLEIQRALGINELLANKVSWFLYCNILERVFDCLNTLGRHTLISQEITSVFFRINVMCILSFFIIAYVCINILNFGLGGYVIARYTKTLMETVLELYYIKKLSNESIMQIPALNSLSQNFKRTFLFYIYTAFGIYGTIMALEVSSNFAAVSNSLADTSAWMSFINVVYYCSFIGFGITNTLRTHANIQKGKHNLEKMMWITKLYWKYAIASGLGLGIILFVFSRTIASFFTERPETLNSLASLLRLYAFLVCIDFNMTFCGMVLRLFDRAWQQSICAAIYFPIVMILLSSISTYKYKLGNYGIFACYAFSVVSTYTMILILNIKAGKIYKEEFFERPSLSQLGSDLELTDLSLSAKF